MFDLIERGHHISLYPTVLMRLAGYLSGTTYKLLVLYFALATSVEAWPQHENVWSRHSQALQDAICKSETEIVQDCHPALSQTVRLGQYEVGLFDVGSAGASTEELALLLLRDEVIAFPKFKKMQRGRRIDAYPTMLEGSSVMHSNAITLSGDGREFTSTEIHYGPDGRRIESCSVQVYLWDEKQPGYLLSSALSAQKKRSLCRK